MTSSRPQVGMPYQILYCTLDNFMLSIIWYISKPMSLALHDAFSLFCVFLLAPLHLHSYAMGTLEVMQHYIRSVHLEVYKSQISIKLNVFIGFISIGDVFPPDLSNWIMRPFSQRVKVSAPCLLSVSRMTNAPIMPCDELESSSSDHSLKHLYIVMEKKTYIP